MAKYKSSISLLALLPLFAGTVGCSDKVSNPESKGSRGNELTRPMAQKLIEDFYSKAATAIPRIPQREIDCLTRQGVWQETFEGYHGVLQLTPKGRQTLLMAQYDGSGNPQYTDPPWNEHHAAHPKQAKVEITGITDAPSVYGPNAKTVVYTPHWENAKFPDPVRECIAERPSNVAVPILMKLYDDGWRVEKANPSDL
jgi:hypothetical protein